MARVNIIFHSVSGHTYRLAEALGTGVVQVETCKFKLLRIPEPGGADPITCRASQSGTMNFRISQKRPCMISPTVMVLPLEHRSIGAA